MLLTKTTRLDNLNSEVQDYFLNSEGGCLLGRWTLEVINDISEFKEEIQSYFTNWMRHYI